MGLIEVIEEYKEWESKTNYPDKSVEAFRDYHHKETILAAVREIWGDDGHSMYDSSELKSLLPEDTQYWLNSQYVGDEIE